MNSGEDIRLRLILHYDGSHFHGWQVQPGDRTVQGELETVVERLTGSRRPVVASGRTDRGVHATGQVAAVTVPSRWTAPEFRRALNALLPPDIWVQAVEPAPPDFHPRYDALSRSYVYRIGIREESASPFHRPWCWVLRRELDEELLTSSARLLEGEHSFRAFAKRGQPERGDRCTVLEARWRPWDDMGLAFEITADRFLHHMVRYLVGTMVDIGSGRRPVSDLEALLHDGATPLETSPPAPPEGLFLARVDYPEAAIRLD